MSVFITAEKKREFEEELKYLKNDGRKNAVNKIQEARAFGDLSENAEYDAAKNEQAMIEGEILEIEEKLKHAKVIKDSEIKKGVVSIGSKVEIFDETYGENMVFEIVGTTEADVDANRISNESPVGNALLGRTVGERVTVQVPAGESVMVVKKIL